MMQKIKQISKDILTICKQPNTALQAIHLIIQHGGAGELAWQTVYHRVMADNDVDGAYYLASFAQKIDDLPFDALPLVRLVMMCDDELMKQALLDKMPAESKAALDALLADDVQG